MIATAQPRQCRGSKHWHRTTADAWCRRAYRRLPMGTKRSYCRLPERLIDKFPRVIVELRFAQSAAPAYGASAERSCQPDRLQATPSTTTADAWQAIVQYA